MIRTIFKLKFKLNSYGEVRETEVDDLHFENYEEVLDAQFGDTEAGRHNRDVASRLLSTQDYSWMGIKGGENMSSDEFKRRVEERIRKGWPEGAEQMLGMLDAISPVEARATMGNLRRRRRVKGPFGSELDIHKVYQGQVEKAWTTMRKEMRTVIQNKLVTVFIDLSTRGMVDSDATLWRASVALKLVDYLTRAGKAVKVVVGDSGIDPYMDPGPRVELVSFVAKNYNQPLNIEHLAALCSMAFYRYGMFRGMALHPTRRIKSGFGQMLNDYSVFPHEVLRDEKERDAVIMRVGGAYSAEQAKALFEKCKAQIEKGDDALKLGTKVG